MPVNPFPDLLTYALLAPLMLRVTAAAFFAYLATHHFRNKKAAAPELSILNQHAAVFALGIYALIEALVAVGLFLGLYTQIAALVGFVICLKVLFLRRGLHHIVPLTRSTYVVLSVICMSLLFTGAGLFAQDWPL